MIQPKLIVTDLDGTALQSNKTISPRTRKAFADCHKAGIPIAIATARYINGARPYAEALHADYRILTDGTLTYQNESLVYANEITKEQVQQIVSQLVHYGCTEHIAIPTVHGLFRYPEGIPYDPENPSPKANERQADDHSIGYHMELDTPFPYSASKIVATIYEEKIAVDIAKQARCAQFHYHGEPNYSFLDPTASKLDAILHLTQKLDISLKDVLVFGDDINDIEMIQNCGVGIAMANALDLVKDAADRITASNDEDGIAIILEEVLSEL